MRIALGNDHRGLLLKEALKTHLGAAGQECIDFGTCSDESVDYPDYGFPVAEAVSRGEADRGILICGTGLGMSYVANRVPGAIAALCTSPFMARMSRTHNDANVLVLGGDITSPEEAIEMLDVWLTTEFEGERHERRLNKIRAYEGRKDGKQ